MIKATMASDPRAATSANTGAGSSDWTGADMRALLGELRCGSQSDRRKQALRFDWETGDPAHVGWIMAQKGIDLGTALRVFLNAGPERWNHTLPHHLPDAVRDRCRVLDAMHRRIMAGFYLPDPVAGIGPVRAEMLDWIARQDSDRTEGRTGRWQFRADLLVPLTLSAARADSLPARAEDPRRDWPDMTSEPGLVKPRGGLWRDLLAPFLG